MLTKLKARIIYLALFQLLPGLQSARRETEEELGLGDSFAATCHWIWQSIQVREEQVPTAVPGQTFRDPTRGSWNKIVTTVFRNLWIFHPSEERIFRNGFVGQFQRMEQDFDVFDTYMDVSENRGTPKSSISIGFSIINHPFWGTPIFGNTHIMLQLQLTELNI